MAYGMMDVGRHILRKERIRVSGCDAPYINDATGEPCCMKCGEPVASDRHPSLPCNPYTGTSGTAWWYLEEPEEDDWLLLLQIMEP